MTKEEMAVYLYQFIGTPYIWGGNDTASGGFDCSGFVLEGLRAKGLWGSSDDSSQGIYNVLRKALDPVNAATMGDLLFFGKSTTEITHVAVALNESEMIEAGGGSSTIKQGMVRIRPISWRRDLVKILKIKE